MSKPQEKKWFRPLFDMDEPKSQEKKLNINDEPEDGDKTKVDQTLHMPEFSYNINDKNWMKNFDPVVVEDLAVHTKKLNEVEDWFKKVSHGCCSDMLLITGPVGCGKTITVHTMATKYKMKVSEWITPIDIEIPTEYGQYEYREKQSTKFKDFLIKAANFKSLLDNSNWNKLVLVEDYPNIFIRTPSEFVDVLQKYSGRAKSPIVFICSDSFSDSKSIAGNLFTNTVKEQFKINHITFNGVSVTGLRAALKRVSQIISKKYSTVYSIPTSEMVECVVNSSAGDVRSAVLNLHFACLKGTTFKPETSIMQDKEKKGKIVKKKKTASSKFLAIGKDETVSILHGVGRVLNPKVVTKDGARVFTHAPFEVIEQFGTQPSSFLNFLEENYLPHFSSIDDVDKAARALSDADCMLAEWREKFCQLYGLYVAVSGLMVANSSPVSAWNPVRGPKNMRVTYPTVKEIPLLEENVLYKGKVLVTDFKSYCNIISKNQNEVT